MTDSVLYSLQKYFYHIYSYNMRSLNMWTCKRHAVIHVVVNHTYHDLYYVYFLYLCNYNCKTLWTFHFKWNLTKAIITRHIWRYICWFCYFIFFLRYNQENGCLLCERLNNKSKNAEQSNTPRSIKQSFVVMYAFPS